MWKRATCGAMALTISTLTAGCESATEPRDAPFDVQAALADYDAVESALDDRGIAGFRALARSGAFADVVPDAAGAGSAAPIISDFHRGATFVYDAHEGRYQVDPARQGAPATGVRFVLYESDAAGNPIGDQEIGHADLVDEGDGSVEDVVLRMTVEEDEAIVLDYRAALDEAEGLGTVDVDGYLTDGAVRLDFEVDVAGDGSNSDGWGQIDFDLGIAARDFVISGTVEGHRDQGADEGEVVVFARHGGDSFRVDFRGSDGIIDGEIDLNGEPFATVSGPQGNPIFTSADGDPLTGLEALVLWRMVDGIEDSFDLVEDLLDPVGEIVLLGVIL